MAASPEELLCFFFLCKVNPAWAWLMYISADWLLEPQDAQSSWVGGLTEVNKDVLK